MLAHNKSVFNRPPRPQNSPELLFSPSAEPLTAEEKGFGW